MGHLFGRVLGIPDEGEGAVVNEEGDIKCGPSGSAQTKLPPKTIKNQNAGYVVVERVTLNRQRRSRV